MKTLYKNLISITSAGQYDLYKNQKDIPNRENIKSVKFAIFGGGADKNKLQNGTQYHICTAVHQNGTLIYDDATPHDEPLSQPINSTLNHAPNFAIYVKSIDPADRELKVEFVIETYQ